jgi:hypothetical protein
LPDSIPTALVRPECLLVFANDSAVLIRNAAMAFRFKDRVFHSPLSLLKKLQQPRLLSRVL